jgi:eukaryotic-like serine/threonine-protein kinase
MNAATGHWNRLERLFYGAFELAPAERTAFLDRECGEDPDLRREVESLLAYSAKTLDVLQRPVAEAAQRLAWRDAGQQVGPYRLISFLGEGGMGQVYLASRADHLYEQQVAIKLMHSGLKQAQSMLLRFGTERRILANLNHPNIARLLDAGITPDGAPYLVMEYVDGIRIDEYCLRSRLKPPEILRLFITVSSAVEYAHKNLVVHRDIKPANILVAADGAPKLLDFGIAKLLLPDAGELALTRPTDRIMTPGYASPEQVRGEHVTTATDVYALGVLLYQLLTGQSPFRLESKSPVEVAQIICERDPLPPSAMAALQASRRAPDNTGKLDGDLDNIVLMAMRKEPSRRYASVSAFSADVQAYLSGYPVQARTDRWSYRSGKFVRRHKAAVSVAVVAILALVGFSIAMGVMARRANRARLTAEHETQFLSSIFQAATPNQARGKPVMARDLLDRGARRIDAELAGQPELQATMLDNVGRAYSAIGLYRQAEPLLQRAYDIRRRILGPEALDTASSEDALAMSMRLQSKYAQAEPLFRDALAARQKKLGNNNPLVAESLDNLGECLYWEDRMPEAETALRQALAIHGASKNDTATWGRDALALVLERQGNFPEAAQLMRQSVQMDKTAKGADSPDYIASLHNYAGVLIDAGNLDEAEAVERQVLALWEKVSGPDHPDLQYALNNMAYIFLEKGDPQQAMPFLQRNLKLTREQGEKNPLLAIALNNWARALQQEGDFANAEINFQRALQVADKAAGQKSWIYARVLANIGLLQFDRGDFRAAATLARRSLDIQRQLGGEDTPANASGLIDLAEARFFQGDAADAERLLRQALLIQQKKFNPENPTILATQVRLGEALTQQGKTAQAEPLLRQALAAARGEPFALPAWQIAQIESALGACLVARGHSIEGEQLLRHSERDLANHPRAVFRRPANTRNAPSPPHPV